MFIFRKKRNKYSKRHSRAASRKSKSVVIDLDKRNFVMAGVATALSAASILRIGHMQLLNFSFYKSLSDGNQYRKVAIMPQRGSILDRDGVVLACDKEYYAIFTSPSNAQNISTILRNINKMLTNHKNDADLQQLINLAQRKARQYPKQDIILKSYLDQDEVTRILSDIELMKSIDIGIVNKRNYAFGPGFCHALGYVSANISKSFKLKTNKLIYNNKDFKIGQVGLERHINNVAFGNVGYLVNHVNAYGHSLGSRIVTNAKNGLSTKTTFSSGLQSHILSFMQNNIGVVVVSQVQDGDILSMFSTPNYNPNIIANGFEYQDIVSNDKGFENSSKEAFFNKVTSKTYPPGSIFKTVSLLTALADPDVEVPKKFFCKGKFKIGSSYRYCHVKSGHGWITRDQAFGRSCNCYFYNLAKLLNIDNLYKIAKELGFDQKHILACGDSVKGLIPNTIWKKKAKNEGWYLGETVNSAIGQGYVEATPLQLNIMMARIGSGKKVTLDIMKQYKDFDDLNIAPDALAEMREILKTPFTDKVGGTCRYYHTASPSLHVSGKTGTAQVVSRRIEIEDIKAGNYKTEELPHSLFTGFFPSDSPQYAITVVMENAYGLGKSATRIARIAANYIDKNLKS